MGRSKKFDNFMIILKIIMAQLTAAYSLVMVCCAGAGLIYNGDSYGSKISAMGAVFIMSGIAMTIGAILCLFRRSISNFISLIFSAGGLTVCMIMLNRLCVHADDAGWHDNVTMLPASDMYMTRVLPTIIPAVLAMIISVIQIRSARNRRRNRNDSSIFD